MRSHALLLTLALLTSCEHRAGTQGAEGKLTLPEQLVFPRTFVGFPTEARLALTNAGRAAITVRLSTALPFDLAASDVTLAGGATEEVPIRFSPPAPGPYEGTLVVTDAAGPHEVRLLARAEEPADCRASGPCRASRFDPTTGLCTETLLADDTACDSPCLTDARCSGGQCTGTAKRCDDGNICTRDLCDPRSGCVHDESAPDCPAPTDPCKVPVCDPSTGCGVADAADGTRCGTLDCAGVHLCVQGRCLAVPTPEGMPCQSPGVCAGECRAQRCEETLETRAPAWTYTPPPLRDLHFAGLVDDDANHYWVEWNGPAQAELVSVSRTGAERFRKRLDIQERAWGRATDAIVLAGDLLVLGLSPNRLEARRTQDGSLAWTRNLQDAVAPQLPAPVSYVIPSVQATQLAVDAAGNVVVLASEIGAPSCGDDCWWAGPVRQTLVSFARDGSIRWMQGHDVSVERPQWNLLASDAGELFYGLAYRVFWRLSGEGALLGSGFSGLTPVATDDGWLVYSEEGSSPYDLRITSTSRGPFDDAPALPSLDALRLSGGKAYGFIDPPCSWAGCPPQQPRRAVRVDLATRHEDWSFPADGRAPILTSRESLLFHVPAAAGTPPLLVELSTRDGSPRASCPLPAGLYDTARPTLRSGQWATTVRETDARTGEPIRTVRAFDLPGLDVAPNGWVCDDGSMSRDRRPR